MAGTPLMEFAITESVNVIALWASVVACSLNVILEREMGSLLMMISVIEKSISNGIKVSEVQITTLIEMLMRQAIKLDSIPTEGNASAQKNLQGKRVQKCVETLDVLKLSNARLKSVVVTTKWETFDPPPTSTTTAHWELFD
ncbi:BAG domain containing protein [Trema orientale]|uniref:BAG domain containing protein n=1 Tax=Trema orientale TaxID=63057 RepID=A0A2P5EQF3_TREOI|nr:BAG domain containing protein [Trema orientale]